MRIAFAMVVVLSGSAVADPTMTAVPVPPTLTLQTQLFVEKTPSATDTSSANA